MNSSQFFCPVLPETFDIQSQDFRFVQGSIENLMISPLGAMEKSSQAQNWVYIPIFPVDYSTSLTRHLANVSHYNFCRCSPIVSLSVKHSDTVGIRTSDHANQMIQLSLPYSLHFLLLAGQIQEIRTANLNSHHASKDLITHLLHHILRHSTQILNCFHPSKLRSTRIPPHPLCLATTHPCTYATIPF